MKTLPKAGVVPVAAAFIQWDFSMPEQIDTRAYLRFKPDPLEYAQVAIQSGGDGFTPEFVALIVEESPISGCGLIAHNYPGIEEGTECRVKIGRLAPLRAQVMWRKSMEWDLMRLGLKFLE